MRRIVFASLLALMTGACDKIISSDVAAIPFNLPPRNYSFSSSSLGVPAGLSGEVPCGASAPVPFTDCCNPPAPLPALGCTADQTIACEQNENGTSVCTATATVSQSQMMNLGQEVSQLAGFTGFISISINRISYSVTANTLDVNLPDVILYLAPSGVTDSRDPYAKKFGTLPAIAAKDMPSGDVILEADAKQTLAGFTSDIKSPFNFIAATTVKASHAPTGGIDMTINGQLVASP